MEEIVYSNASRSGLIGMSVDWSAIWAGLFTFIAIWSVFGFLGAAIFSGGANPAISQPTQSLSFGIGIWAIILTGIAMYAAGVATGRFAGLDGRLAGAAHGMVMFGLSITAAIVLNRASGILFSGYPVSIRGLHMISAFGGSEWMTFIGLLVGWLTAMLGAVSGSQRKSAIPGSNVRDMRPAA